MRVELLKAWKHCVPPFVLEDVQEGLAELMVRRKIGRIVQPIAQTPKQEELRKEAKKREHR
jgi:hypothetical protein